MEIKESGIYNINYKFSFAITIKSFFRRLRCKSSFYFSLPIALFFGFVFQSPMIFFLIIGNLSMLLLFISYLIVENDKSKKTGVKCVLCFHDHCHLFYPGKKKKFKQEKGSFACSSFDHGKHGDIYYCPMCKNGFLIEVATEKLEDFKKQGIDLYQDVVDNEYIANIEARHLTYSKLLKRYSEYFYNKDVLEVGQYYGAFLDVAHDKVKSYVGIEPSRHACEYVKKNHPSFTILNGPVDSVIEDSKLRNYLFDTIFLFDVIEHVPDPVGMIQKLHTYLRPGGYLIFSTINIESTLAIAMGPKWPWYMDMHYYYFSDRGYVDMLLRSGYGLKKHAHYPYVVKFHYFIRKVLSLFFGELTLPKWLIKITSFNIPINFGDVVLIIGKKETSPF